MREAEAGLAPSAIQRLRDRVSFVVRSFAEKPTARGAAIAFMIYCGGTVAGYVVQAVLARLLTVPEYGSYSFVLSWTDLLGIAASVGMPAVVLRFVPYYRAHDDVASYKGLIRASYAYVFLAGLLLFVAGQLIVAIFGTPTDVRPAVWQSAIFLVPLQGLILLQLQMMRSHGWIVAAYAPSMIGRSVATMALVGLFWKLGISLDATWTVTSVVLSLLAVVVVQWLLFRARDAWQHDAAEPLAHHSEWLHAAWPFLLSAFVSNLLTRVDVIMVGMLRGSTDVAIYSAASKTATTLSFVYLSVNAVVGPNISHRSALGQKQELQRLISRATAATFGAAVIAVLGLLLGGHLVLGLFGSAYQSGYGVMAVIALSHVVVAAAAFGPVVLGMTGHQPKVLMVISGAVGLNVALALLIGPRLGLYGPAVAMLIGTVVAYGGTAVVARRMVGIHVALPFVLKRKYLV